MSDSSPPLKVVDADDSSKNKQEVHENQPHQEASRLEKLSALGMFFIVGPILIFLNRWILVEKNFHYPAMLCSMGIFACFTFSAAAVTTGRATLEHREMMTLQFYLGRVMPIGFFQAATLISGNAAYLFLSVAFAQILKSVAPVILVTLLLTAKLEEPSLLLGVSIAMIVIGSVCAVTGSVAVSLTGALLMLTSEFCESCKLLWTQLILTKFKFSIVEGFYWISPPSIFWLCLYSAIFEFPQMHQEGGFMILSTNWFLFVCAAILGLLINYASWWVTKCCGALTLRITSVFRNICIVCYSPMIFGDVLTVSEIFWYLFATIGIGVYQYVKLKPEVAKKVTLQTVFSCFIEPPQHIKNGSLRPEEASLITVET